MLSIILLCALALPQDPVVPPMVKLDTSPGAELWYEVRSQAMAEGAIVEGPLAGAAEAARAVNAAIADPGFWGRLDGLAIGAEPGEWLATEVPFAGKQIAQGHTRKELRAALDTLLAGMDSAAPEWIEKEWPARKAKLVERQAELTKILDVDTRNEAWMRMDRWLQVTPPEAEVLVTLVTRAPGLAAETWYDADGTMSVVAVEGRSTSTLLEAVLHEYLHALTATPHMLPSLFKVALQALAEKNIWGYENRDAWVHPLYYLAAAEVVRDVHDPKHVDQGLTEGYYDEIKVQYSYLEPMWRDYVNGMVSPNAFCRMLAKAAKAIDR